MSLKSNNEIMEFVDEFQIFLQQWQNRISDETMVEVFIGMMGAGAVRGGIEKEFFVYLDEVISVVRKRLKESVIHDA